MKTLIPIGAILFGSFFGNSLAAPISFDTTGGDAWLFETHVSGTLGDSSCDDVIVHSPAGVVRTLRLDKRFVGTVRLLPGENALQAACLRDGREIERTAPEYWHLQLTDRPRAWIRIHPSTQGVRVNADRTERAKAHPAVIVQYEWFAHDTNPADLYLTDGRAIKRTQPIQADQIELKLPTVDGDYQIQLHATDALGRSDASSAVFRIAQGRAESVQLEHTHPQWVDRAIVYGATPYVFDPQTFTGIRQRLDEIAGLGATVLWLSPITDAPDDDFGYEVTDHFNVRRRFGTMTMFRSLIQHAHTLGLKVIVDFVPNHFSQHHPYYLHSTAHSQRSAYYGWFDRDESGQVTQYFDWSHLKNLNYDNPAVQNYVIEAFSHFVRDLDVDGFRIDASWAVAERAPEFWPRLRTELKRIDPDIFLLAEASARDPYNFLNGFDAAYDWTDQLGEWAWHDVFFEGSAHLDRLRAALTNDGRGFTPNSLVLRFLNNNDTGERFITRHGLAMTKLAATLLFTLPGLPLIYNGDEMGAEFLPYDEGPPLHWDDKHALAQHYRALASLRNRHEPLRSGALHLLKTTQDQSLLAFTRMTRDATMLVVLNFSDDRVALRGADQATRVILRQFDRATDTLSEQAIADMDSFALPARTAVVLTPHGR